MLGRGTALWTRLTSHRLVYADVIGIDLGITMLMAENQRTGLVWSTFMKNPEAVAAMAAVGFH